jgi:hypothetical protein
MQTSHSGSFLRIRKIDVCVLSTHFNVGPKKKVLQRLCDIKLFSITMLRTWHFLVVYGEKSNDHL